MPEDKSTAAAEKSSSSSITFGPSSVGPLINVTKIHQNLSQEVIMITEDKLRLVLTEHLKKMEIRREWLAPLGIFLTIIISFSTSTFKNAILDASTWQAIFVIIAALSLLWFVLSAYRAWKAERLEDIVSQIKKGSTVG